MVWKTRKKDRSRDEKEKIRDAGTGYGSRMMVTHCGDFGELKIYCQVMLTH